MKPDGEALLGEISSKYSQDAVGQVDVIQSVNRFPHGGDTLRLRESPTIANGDTGLNIFEVDGAGTVLEKLRIDPRGDAAVELFGAK